MKQWKWISACFFFVASLKAEGAKAVGTASPEQSVKASKRKKPEVEGSLHLGRKERFGSERDLLPSKDQRLRLGLKIRDEGSLNLSTFVNPYRVVEEAQWSVVVNLFEGLIVSKGFKQMPGLAESWSHSQDLKQWTFHIRPGARWSDGVPVRAQDFVFGFQMLCNPKTYGDAVLDRSRAAAEQALQGVPIRNAQSALKGECSIDQLGVYAQDAKTLCFELEQPILPELLLCALSGPHFYPLRLEQWEKMVQDRPEALFPLLGCGAFVLDQLKTPSSFTLKRNPFYWNQREGRLQQVDIELSSEIGRLGALWDQGAIDCYLVPPSADLSVRQKLHLWAVRRSAYEAIAWAPHHPVLRKKSVRRALNALFNREALLALWEMKKAQTPLLGLRAEKSSPPLESGGELPEETDRALGEAEEEEERFLEEQREEEEYRRSLKLRAEEARKCLEGEQQQGGEANAEKPWFQLTLRHPYLHKEEVNRSLDSIFNPIPEYLSVKVEPLEGQEEQDGAMRFQTVSHLPHWFYRFSAFRSIKDQEGRTIENSFGFENERYNQIVHELESGVGLPPVLEAAQKAWKEERLSALDQIIREELPVLPWRESLARYVVHPEVGGLPRFDYVEEGERTHHHSGALYFQELFVRALDEEEAKLSPTTGRKRPEFVLKEKPPAPRSPYAPPPKRFWGWGGSGI